MCFSCDRRDRVKDNGQAIEKTIATRRGIEPWGTGDMVAAAFSGLEALPSPDMVSDDHLSTWWAILGVSPDASESDIRAAYLAKVREMGSTSAERNGARDAALVACAA
jgi:hypothetical protein